MIAMLGLRLLHHGLEETGWPGVMVVVVIAVLLLAWPAISRRAGRRI